MYMYMYRYKYRYMYMYVCKYMYMCMYMAILRPNPSFYFFIFSLTPRKQWKVGRPQNSTRGLVPLRRSDSPREIDIKGFSESLWSGRGIKLNSMFLFNRPDTSLQFFKARVLEPRYAYVYVHVHASFCVGVGVGLCLWLCLYLYLCI